MKNTKWGILGAGGIATKFAEDLNYVSNASLFAVASKTSNKAKQTSMSITQSLLNTKLAK